MANYYFRLRDTKATKETPIVLYAQINGNRIKCKTGQNIHPNAWDEKLKRPIKTKDTKLIIDRLNYLLAVANDVYLYFRDTLKDANPTSTDYQNKFYEVSGIESNKPDTPKDDNIFECIDTWLANAKNRINPKTQKPISTGTLINMRQMQKNLQAFSKQVRKVDFNTIDLDFYNKFTAYLYKNGYSINSVGKFIRQLKTILNDATERGINTNYAYKSKKFVAANVKADSIYLNETELDELFNLDLTDDKKLERVRDLFLVGCYTGLRFSDFTNIKPENIKGDFFEITAKKTNTSIVVPIHPRLREIMARYEGITVNSLPSSISNQKMNEYLKQVCAMAVSLNDSINTETNKGNFIVHTDSPKYTKVATHTARSTFATNQYNKGIPANILMKITGHATESAFYKYIKGTPKENALRLREVWAKEFSHLKVV